MKFTREINRLLTVTLLAFAIVAISATYWAIIGPDTLLKRDDNRRLIDAEASIVRGDIVDRSGDQLATSTRQDDGTVSREYLYPAASSALGYFSLRYGVGGAEAAYDPVLRGDDLDDSLNTYINQDLLHRPQVGSDIRLTLDINVQQQIAAAMGDHPGAAVVMTVPDGEILALVSLPTYDPNTLDAAWERLIAAPGKPFFNRVLQGAYQPGGLLETPLLAAALLARQPVDESIADARAPIRLKDVTLTCALQPTSDTLTLLQAYTYTCPSPFAQLANTLGEDAMQSAFAEFGLYQPLTLGGFITQPSGDVPTPEATEWVLTDSDFTEDALGQGQLTVSPLNIAVIAAAVINGGNAPQPYILSAIRRPDVADWTAVSDIRPSIPITTADIASQIRNLMSQTVETGEFWQSTPFGVEMGGHIAVAHSGEGSHVWFMGFASLDDNRGIAAAVVVENSDDPALAADIGGAALLAGVKALR